MESDIKYLVHQIKIKNKQLDGKNHTVAIFDPKKCKNKDLSNGENLPKALIDEVLGSIPSYFQDISSILIEPTQPINLRIEESPKIIHVAQSLSTKEKAHFANFFQDQKINFAWTYLDMLGLDTDLIMHHLSISLDKKTIKKKLRKMHPHVALLVKGELEKLLSANFIRAIDYAKWISNIVPISKYDKSIQVCTNFRDLNKACPKNYFPLPNIDMIVDMIVGCEMYSLKDGFSRYNKIKIALVDQEKTIFTCAWGTFCWNVMPFGLKNSSATYKRVMSSIFHDMMHKNMEDYVDDALEKSRK